MKAEHRHRLSGVYLITDPALHGSDALAIAVVAALEGGVRLLQFRDKRALSDAQVEEARQLRELCHANDALFIVNDHVDLALACEADGVHLGQDDGGIDEARTRLGDDAIIGASCYNDLTRAKRAARAGADYLAFGSVFPSSTKPAATRAELSLFALAAGLDLPLCAIGGITTENAGSVIAAGANMLAVISGVFAAEDIRAAAADYAAAFDAFNSANHVNH